MRVLLGGFWGSGGGVVGEPYVLHVCIDGWGVQIRGCCGVHLMRPDVTADKKYMSDTFLVKDVINLGKF